MKKSFLYALIMVLLMIVPKNAKTLDNDPNVIQQLAEIQQKINKYDLEIATNESLRKSKEVLESYGKIADVYRYNYNEPFMPEQFNTAARKQQAKDINERIQFAVGKINQEVEKLEKANRFEEVLKLYQLAPYKFTYAIIDVKVKIKLQPIKNDFMQTKARANLDMQQRINAYLGIIDTLNRHGKVQSVLDFKAEILEEIRKIAKEFESQKKYAQALAIFQKLPDDFAVDIVKLKNIEKIPQVLAQAKALAKQKKYAEAYVLLAPLKFDKEVKELDEQIREAQKKEPKKEEPAPKGDWVFLRTTQQKDTPPDEKGDWHVKDGNLELNKKAVDVMTQDSFAELLEEAKKNDIPFVLIGLRKGNFYHFFGKEILEGLKANWKNPITKEAPDIAEVYIADDNGNFSLLMNITRYNFQDKFSTIESLFKSPKNERYLYVGIILEITANEQASRGLKEASEITLQNARNWYDLGVQKLQKGTKDYNLVQQQRDKIPNKPGLGAPKPAPAPGNLVQALNSLTTALNQVSGALK